MLDVERLTGYEGLSRAQVDYLQVVTVIHQHVVRLQVQVDDSTAVKVVDRTQDLNQQLCDLRLCVLISERAPTRKDRFVKLNCSV